MPESKPLLPQEVVSVVHANVGSAGLWYLASPYSHHDEAMQVRRFEAVARTAGFLVSQFKLFVFSPIAHTFEPEKQLIKAGMLTPEQAAAFAMPWDKRFFPMTHGAIVACLPGWQASAGIKQEVFDMLAAHKPVIYMDPRPFFSDEEWAALEEGERDVDRKQGPNVVAGEPSGGEADAAGEPSSGGEPEPEDEGDAVFEPTDPIPGSIEPEVRGSDAGEGGEAPAVEGSDPEVSESDPGASRMQSRRDRKARDTA